LITLLKRFFRHKNGVTGYGVELKKETLRTLEWRVQKNEKEEICTKQASRMAGVSPMSSVNPRQRNGIAQIRPYLCGGMAAVAAEMATFPLDTAKTRQQLQGQVGDSRWSSLRYKGIAHTLITIGKEEGLTSIYRGLSPALVRQSVYGTIKFGLYYSSKDVAKRLVRHPQKESTLVNLCCAVVAGSVSATLATPTDVIKVRMQSGSMHKGANISWSLLSVGKVVLRHEGIRGLWRGGLPTAQRAALVAGVQLPVYDATKSQMLAHGVPDGAACHMAASVLAGLSACIASNPVDVVRTRMMVQRKTLRSIRGLPVQSSYGETMPHNSYHTSSLRCGLHTARTEGLLALYKGFFPAFARMGPWNIIFFVVYEKLQHSYPYIGR